jgi:carbohydrate kinase (thermoresistant glucokinase family)
VNVPGNKPGAGKPVIVLMGVSGAAKTTVGRLLAGMIGAEFEEGDKFHPQANIAKMSGGTPLTDADRLPWLAAIAQSIDQAREEGRGVVVACSALKRAYRDILIGGREDVRLVYLKGSLGLIEGRLGARKGHFMPPQLLKSQFASLEEPVAAERPIVVEIAAPPRDIARAIYDRLNGKVSF